jgi:hypothetical protein
MKATTTKQQNVYDLLEKLEGLQTKKDALESEIRETRALLNEKFRTLQERVGKANVTPHSSPCAPAGTPVTSYEPVTTYRVILEKNPKTGETKRVVTPVTSYVLRQSVPTVTTYGVPRTTPACAPQPATAAVTMPAPCVPPQTGTVVVPPQDVGCPVTPTSDTVVTPGPRPIKAATPTDRPVPSKKDFSGEGVPKTPSPASTANPSPK